jgi:hypothetical protein
MQSGSECCKRRMCAVGEGLPRVSVSGARSRACGGCAGAGKARGTWVYGQERKGWADVRHGSPPPQRLSQASAPNGIWTN